VLILWTLWGDLSGHVFIWACLFGHVFIWACFYLGMFIWARLFGQIDWADFIWGDF
jgi:hypothetical protein